MCEMPSIISIIEVFPSISSDFQRIMYSFVFVVFSWDYFYIGEKVIDFFHLVEKYFPISTESIMYVFLQYGNIFDFFSIIDCTLSMCIDLGRRVISIGASIQ
jgi:hypothetical protein